MRERKDILFGAPLKSSGEFDLLVENGDFVVANSDQQNVRCIMEANQGQFRQFPFLGVGIRKMLNGFVEGPERRFMQLQLEGDGYRANKITYFNGELKIELG